MIRYDMPRAEYDALSAEHWSTLKHIARSPAHYLHSVLAAHADMDTDALAFGRALHLAVLEPSRCAQEIAVWDGGTRRGKAWEAFAAEHAGLELITRAQRQKIGSMVASISNTTEIAAMLTGGNAEVSIAWKDADTGLDCKGRLDYVREPSDSLKDAGGIIDLKTCRDASPDAFGRASLRYGYHGQAAFYCDGLAANSLSGRPLPYSIIAIEVAPPYVAQVYRLSEDVIELGREEYRRCLDRVAECKRSGQWPGYSARQMDLQLPKWAWGNDDDLEALGLEFGETDE